VFLIGKIVFEHNILLYDDSFCLVKLSYFFIVNFSVEVNLLSMYANAIAFLSIISQTQLS
jgi:hypothetical protein